MKGKILFKNISGVLKDVDVKNRIVSGYFSAFGNVDSDNDVIMPGAYTKTISENGPTGSQRIKHLLQHNTDQPLGLIKELKEDNYGLFFRSQLVPTSYGLDTILLYDAGVYNEHSVGFQTVKSQSKGSYNEIQEIKLWEGSTVTWGSNANTPVTGMKAKFTVDQFAEKLDRLQNSIKAGSFTGENEYLLELSFNEVKGMYETLSGHVSAIPEPDEPLDPLKSNPAANALDPQSVLNALKELTAKIS